MKILVSRLSALNPAGILACMLLASLCFGEEPIPPAKTPRVFDLSKIPTIGKSDYDAVKEIYLQNREKLATAFLSLKRMKETGAYDEARQMGRLDGLNDRLGGADEAIRDMVRRGGEKAFILLERMFVSEGPANERLSFEASAAIVSYRDRMHDQVMARLLEDERFKGIAIGANDFGSSPKTVQGDKDVTLKAMDPTGKITDAMLVEEYEKIWVKLTGFSSSALGVARHEASNQFPDPRSFSSAVSYYKALNTTIQKMRSNPEAYPFDGSMLSQVIRRTLSAYDENRPTFFIYEKDPRTGRVERRPGDLSEIYRMVPAMVKSMAAGAVAGNLLFAHRYEHEYEDLARLNEHLKKYSDRGLEGVTLILLGEAQLRKYEVISHAGLSDEMMEKHLRALYGDYLRAIHAGDPNPERSVNDAITDMYLALQVNAAYDRRKAARDSGDPDFMAKVSDEKIYRKVAETLAARRGRSLAATDPLTKGDLEGARRFYKNTTFRMLEQGVHVTAGTLFQQMLNPSVAEVLRFHGVAKEHDLPRFDGYPPPKKPLPYSELVKRSLDEATKKVRLHAYATLKNMMSEMTPLESMRFVDHFKAPAEAKAIRAIARSIEIERLALTSWKGKAAHFLAERKKELDKLQGDLGNLVLDLRTAWRAGDFTAAKLRQGMLKRGGAILGFHEFQDLDKTGTKISTATRWDAQRFFERQMDLGNLASLVNIAEAYQVGGAQAALEKTFDEVAGNMPGAIEEMSGIPGIVLVHATVKGLVEGDMTGAGMAAAAYIPGVGQIWALMTIEMGLVRIGGRAMLDPLKDDQVSAIYAGYTWGTNADGSRRRVEARRGCLLDKVPLRIWVAPEGIMDLNRDPEAEYRAAHRETIDQDCRNYANALADQRFDTLEDMIFAADALDEAKRYREEREAIAAAKAKFADAGLIGDIRLDALRQNVYLFFHDTYEESLRKKQPDKADKTFADMLPLRKDASDEKFAAFVEESFPNPPPEGELQRIQAALEGVESATLKHPERVLAGLRARQKRLLETKEFQDAKRKAVDEEAATERELIRPIIEEYVKSWFTATGRFGNSEENMVSPARGRNFYLEVKDRLIDLLLKDYFVSRFLYFQALKDRALAERQMRAEQARRALNWRSAAQRAAERDAGQDPSALQVLGESMILGEGPQAIPPLSPEVEIASVWLEEKDLPAGEAPQAKDRLGVRVRVRGSARRFDPPFKVQSVEVKEVDASALPRTQSGNAQGKPKAYKIMAAVVDNSGKPVGTGEAFLISNPMAGLASVAIQGCRLLRDPKAAPVRTAQGRPNAGKGEQIYVGESASLELTYTVTNPGNGFVGADVEYDGGKSAAVALPNVLPGAESIQSRLSSAEWGRAGQHRMLFPISPPVDQTREYTFVVYGYESGTLKRVALARSAPITVSAFPLGWALTEVDTKDAGKFADGTVVRRFNRGMWSGGVTHRLPAELTAEIKAEQGAVIGSRTVVSKGNLDGVPFEWTQTETLSLEGIPNLLVDGQTYTLRARAAVASKSSAPITRGDLVHLELDDGDSSFLREKLDSARFGPVERLQSAISEKIGSWFKDKPLAPTIEAPPGAPEQGAVKNVNLEVRAGPARSKDCPTYDWKLQLTVAYDAGKGADKSITLRFARVDEGRDVKPAEWPASTGERTADGDGGRGTVGGGGTGTSGGGTATGGGGAAPPPYVVASGGGSEGRTTPATGTNSAGEEVPAYVRTSGGLEGGARALTVEEPLHRVRRTLWPS